MGTISASTPFFAYFWASLTGGGSGGSSTNDGGSGSGGQTTIDYQAALDQGIKDAENVLENASDKCKALFNGKDPSALLKELKDGNRIKLGTAYQQYNEDKGRNITKQFDIYTHGIAPTVQGALGLKYPMIYINMNGAFFTDRVTFRNGSGVAHEWYGVKSGQISAFVILHELIHAAGRIHETSEEQKFNEMLRDECFKKK
jgi:hypothetical protein